MNYVLIKSNNNYKHDDSVTICVVKETEKMELMLRMFKDVTPLHDKGAWGLILEGWKMLSTCNFLERCKTWLSQLVFSNFECM